MGYPHPGSRDEVSPVRSGQGGTPGWGTPPGQGWGNPPWDRIADGVLDTRQVVCLLRSRKRTLLFIFATIGNNMKFTPDLDVKREGN